MKNTTKITRNPLTLSVRWLARYRRAILWGTLLGFVGFMLMYLFAGLNTTYIDYIKSGYISDSAEFLFGRYLDIVLFFVFYFICSLVFCITVSSENTDYSLGLIIVYLVIGILNQINDFNYGYTIWNSLLDILCQVLYELSVVPIIFYVALRMKKHQNKMMLLMFCELVVCILYMIGIFASDTSQLSLFKDISCSAIFLVVFITILLIVVLEYRDGNEQLKSLLMLQVISLIMSAISVTVSLVFQNDYYKYLEEAYISLVVRYDITPFRQLILQNILVFAVMADIVVSYIKAFLYRREMNHTLELEMDLAKEYAESVKARIDEVRTIKHDIKNHINLLNMYYSEGDLDKLGEYLAQLDTSIVELRPLTYSKNKLIDYILMSYSEKFKAEGFKFSASARVSENLPIADSELCSLITNMLSNALEGCRNSRMEHDDGGHVRYIMSMTKSKVQIKCENSCSRRKVLRPTGDVLETEKPNSSASHGYGMSIIKRICEKNGGAVLFSAEDGIFVLSAVLPLDYDK